jgi:hypothetical protein
MVEDRNSDMRYVHYACSDMDLKIYIKYGGTHHKHLTGIIEKIMTSEEV